MLQIHELLSRSPLLYKPEWVTVLPAAKQGAYLWVLSYIFIYECVESISVQMQLNFSFYSENNVV